MEVSVIVPTLNEAENLPLLLPAVAAALAGRQFEVIIVDDGSTDATEIVCRQLATTYPLKLLIRRRPIDGLGGAVLHGMAQAQGEYLIVMDADLQHPPDRLPALLEPLQKNQADFVIGSRYVPGGGTSEGWTFYRRINSGFATFLARPFSGRTTDPMSGFFALRKSTYAAAQRLTPLGYKIGLELMCKCRVKRVTEIPIHFGLRSRGESKLSFMQQFRYLEHLSRLYDFTYPRASPAIKFLIATGASWFVGACVFAILITQKATEPAAVVWAYLAALLVTTLFFSRYVKTQRPFIVRRRPWIDFAVICCAEWVVCMAAAAWTANRIAAPTATEAFVYPFAAATLARYILRKELLHDIRGLRHEARATDLAAPPENG